MSNEDVEVKLGAQTGPLNAGLDSAVSTLNASVAAMTEALQGLTAKTTASAHTMSEAHKSVESSAKHMGEGVSGTYTTMGSKIRESVQASANDLEHLHLRIRSMTDVFSKFGEALIAAFAVERFKEMIEKAADFAVELERSAEKTGIATDELQRLGMAAEMNEASIGGLEVGMRRLATQMEEAHKGSAAAVDMFRRVGISMEQLKTMSIEDVYKRVADTFHNTADGAEKMALSVQLFGRAGLEQIPMLDQGSEGMKAWADEAERLGIILTEQDTAALVGFHDTTKEAGQATSGFAHKLSAELAPALTGLYQAFIDSAKEDSGLNDALKITVEVLADLLKGAANVVVGFITGFKILVEGAEEFGNALYHIYEATARGAGQLLRGNFSGAAAAFHDEISAMGSDATKFGERLGVIAADARKEIGTIWQDKDWMGATGGADKAAPKGKIGAALDPSQEMADWKMQLEQKKAAEGSFHEMSKAEEAEFWQGKLAIMRLQGLATTKEYKQLQLEILKLQNDAHKQSFQDDLSALELKHSAARAGSEQRIAIAAQEAEKIGQTYGWDSKEYNKAQQQLTADAKAWSDEQIKISDERTAIERNHAVALIGIEREQLSTKYALGQITRGEQLDAEKAFEDKIYALKMKEAQDELALQTKGTAGYEATLGKIRALEDAHATAVVKNAGQTAVELGKIWTDLGTRMSGLWDKGIQAMMNGTLTWRSAFRAIGAELVGWFATDVVGKKVKHWISGEIAQTGGTAAGNAARLAIESTAAIRSVAISAAASIKKILMSAYETFGAIYAAIAKIPYVGPFLAPAMAVAGMGAVAGKASSISSAAGGMWSVPSDQLMQVHKKESILPASISEKLRGMVEGGGGLGGMGDVHFHVNTLDGRSFSQYIKDNGHHVVAALRAQHRGFATP